MIDEAFLPIHQLIEQMLSFKGLIVDEGAGIRSCIYECAIDSPLELSIGRNSDGTLAIGSAPPLYYVDTSVQPSFHRVRFSAELSGEFNGI